MLSRLEPRSARLVARCLTLLRDWSLHAEQYWYPVPDADHLGCYGTGYNAWGVQTNQKYLSAMAVLGTLGACSDDIDLAVSEQARTRALTALRFSLSSHISGPGQCTDGTQWGHTWISALGVERMMHGVCLLRPYLDAEDYASLRRVLSSEADWLLAHHCRGGHQGVFADPWNHTGKNVPESNLWNGALLWRAAVMYPDNSHAAAWREQAHRFLINAISAPVDAEDARLVAGRKVKDWYVGANFFPHYALDHHGYLNVGYMVICLSNAAMLHFDMRALGCPVPESLYHHNVDLWHVVRRMIFSNGRLARIGGDSRLRYTYCQEYLLPTLVYAADQLGESNATELLTAQLDLIETEVDFNAQVNETRGSFYGRRLGRLAKRSPYYYTRLESDRACVLGMTAAYLLQCADGACASPRYAKREPGPAVVGFEESVSGTWCEPEHGAVLQRVPTRLASFAWRAHGIAQGMCVPPDAGHMAEWAQNLNGVIRFLGDDGMISGGQTRHRALVEHEIACFEGGFVTWGTVQEGVDLTLAEGWHGEVAGVQQSAFVALPDGHTVVGMQYCRAEDHRVYLSEVKGLHLNLPNDLYNDFQRRLVTARGDVVLNSPPERDEVVSLDSTWVNVANMLGAVGVYGADEHLVVHRSDQRRGGAYASLYVDEVCFPCVLGTRAWEPQSVILDAGWSVLSACDSDETQTFAQSARALRWDKLIHLRGIQCVGVDGRAYMVVANFGAEVSSVALFDVLEARAVQDLVTGEVLTSSAGARALDPGHVAVFVLN